MSAQMATLTFDLTDADAREEFRMIQRARGLASMVYEIGSELRNMRKHGFQGTTEEALDRLADLYYDLVNQYGLQEDAY